MAVLKDLFAQLPFDQVWAALGGGPEASQARTEYENLYKAFQTAKPADNSRHMRIVLELTESFWAGEAPTLQACGYLPEDEEPYALGVLPVEELVGLDIDPKTLADYPAAQIAALCLADCAFDASAAASAWSAVSDSGGASSLLESESCMDSPVSGASLTDTRRELGLDKPMSNKEKYGFMF